MQLVSLVQLARSAELAALPPATLPHARHVECFHLTYCTCLLPPQAPPHYFIAAALDVPPHHCHARHRQHLAALLLATLPPRCMPCCHCHAGGNAALATALLLCCHHYRALRSLLLCPQLSARHLVPARRLCDDVGTLYNCLDLTALWRRGVWKHCATGYFW